MTANANRWLPATRAICLAIIATIGSAVALAEEQPVLAAEMRADIDRLMEVTKAYDPALFEQLGDVIAQQIARTVGATTPEAVARCAEISLQTVSEIFADGDFQQELNGLYGRYFSHEDIRQLLAFYETPTGRKAIEVMPQLTAESMQVTMSWMARMQPVIQERVAKQLREEGLVE